MADAMTAERQRLEAALVRVLARAGIPGEALKPLVLECCQTASDWAEYRGEPAADPVELAAEINAGDLIEQVRYILDQSGLADGEARIMDLIWAKAYAA